MPWWKVPFSVLVHLAQWSDSKMNSLCQCLRFQNLRGLRGVSVQGCLGISWYKTIIQDIFPLKVLSEGLPLHLSPYNNTAKTGQCLTKSHTPIFLFRKCRPSWHFELVFKIWQWRSDVYRTAIGYNLKYIAFFCKIKNSVMFLSI